MKLHHIRTWNQQDSANQEAAWLTAHGMPATVAEITKDNGETAWAVFRTTDGAITAETTPKSVTA